MSAATEKRTVRAIGLGDEALPADVNRPRRGALSAAWVG
jgi:hypothetical protein